MAQVTSRDRNSARARADYWSWHGEVFCEARERL